ncbi:MAG: ATP-binding cassette domain-containing protein [Cytophagales bacterium]|nr:MAG: ATP-binding cassette domain-containing protein [Cytophagales bacterium]
MNFNSLTGVHEVFLSIYKETYNHNNLQKSLNILHYPSEPSISDFVNYLIESGAVPHLAYVRKGIGLAELKDLLPKSYYPLMCLSDQGLGNIIPVIFHNDNTNIKAYLVHTDKEIEERQIKINDDIFDSLIRNDIESKASSDTHEVLLLSCFPNRSIYTSEDWEDHHKQVLPKESKSQALMRFFRILVSEKREITYLYVYAIISGVISLGLPLGIQSIIGFVTSGQVPTSVYVLIFFIVVSIIISGSLQIMQLSISERIQQRLFTKTAFEFAFRMPKIKIESILNDYPPELMNRFFDTLTLQKGMNTILIDFSTGILQVILGLMLLALYHPYFIFFGIFLIGILLIIISLVGPKGLKTSLKESKYKYMVANWLQEIARALSTFKLAGYSNLPMEKTDYFVSNYLHYRQKHYKLLVIQYTSFVVFKTLITAGLLILGCILLVSKEINIGQFVASEIVIIIVMNAIEKVVLKLDTLYDVLTSVEKIGAVTDLPIEHTNGIKLENLENQESGLEIDLKNIKYKYPSEKSYQLNGISLNIHPGEKICMAGYNGAGKTTLINIMIGFLPSYEGVISYNNISLKDINKYSLINTIGDNVSQEDLFDGTVIENITLGRNGINIQDVMWAIDFVGLTKFVNSLKNGLETRLVGGAMSIPENAAKKLIVARSIIMKPKLLILEDFMGGMIKEEKINMLNKLLGTIYPWTVIMVSNDDEIMKMCGRTIVLKEGKVLADDTYNNLSKTGILDQLS